MPTVGERIAEAVVTRLQAALAGVTGASGVLVKARPVAESEGGDPALTVVVTVGPGRYEAAADGVRFGYYPVRATAVAAVNQPTAGGTQPWLPEVREVCLRAMLDFRPLTAGVPELDDADPAPDLERGWYTPNLATGRDWAVAGVTFRTWEAY